MSENIKTSAENLPLTKKGIKTRNSLLEAAEEIFGTRGFFNSSIVDITKKANVAQGTFYLYFSSKQMIFEELVKQLNKDFRSQIRMEVAKAKDAREAQMIGFRTFFHWALKHRNLYNIVQQSSIVNPELHRWYYDRIAKGYVKGLEEAMKGGEFKKLDPEVIAYALMGISQFLGMRWVYWENQDVPEQIFIDTMKFIFEGLSE